MSTFNNLFQLCPCYPYHLLKNFHFAPSDCVGQKNVFVPPPSNSTPSIYTAYLTDHSYTHIFFQSCSMECMWKLLAASV